MGSRIMHYCIASMVNKSLRIQDTAFYLGSLAPDVHAYMGTSQYHATHFSLRSKQGETYTDYGVFISKYLTGRPSPFHLGYYFHLIADEYWRKEFYYKKVKCLSPKEQQEALQKNYRDFWRLNGRIIDHHSLKLHDLNPGGAGDLMDEMDHRHLPKLIQALRRDFEQKDAAKDEELEFWHFAEVLDFLDQSARACLEAHRHLIEQGL
jgi:hypothetical protein